MQISIYTQGQSEIKDFNDEGIARLMKDRDNKILKDIQRNFTDNELESWGEKFKSWTEKYEVALSNYIKNSQNQGNSIKRLTDEGAALLVDFEREFEINISSATFFRTTDTAEDGKEIEKLTYRIAPKEDSFSKATVSRSSDGKRAKPRIIAKSENQLNQISEEKFFDIEIKLEKADNIEQMYRNTLLAYWEEIEKLIGSKRSIEDNLKNLGKANQSFNEGVLGEAVLTAYIIQDHVQQMSQKYREMNNVHDWPTNLQDLGGPEPQKILEELSGLILKKKQYASFATGDIEYSDIWDSFHMYNIILADLNNRAEIYSREKITVPRQIIRDTEESKALNSLYERYKFFKFQIKKASLGDEKGRTIYNFCQMWYKFLTNGDIRKKLIELEYQGFKKLLEQTRGTTTSNFKNLLLKELNLSLKKISITSNKYLKSSKKKN